MPRAVCCYWQKTGQCRRGDRCDFANTHNRSNRTRPNNDGHFVGDDHRSIPEVGQDEVRREDLGDGYDESAAGNDQEINVFSVDCPTDPTSKLIAGATADDQDSNDEDNVPTLVSSSSEDDSDSDDDSEERKHNLKENK